MAASFEATHGSYNLGKESEVSKQYPSFTDPLTSARWCCQTAGKRRWGFGCGDQLSKMLHHWNVRNAMGGGGDVAEHSRWVEYCTVLAVAEKYSLLVFWFQISNFLKGQCREIFCFRFFSWITFSQAPENNIRVMSNFFENLRCKVQGAPPVSLTPVAKLTPVSTTPAANFATSSTCVADTGGK